MVLLVEGMHVFTGKNFEVKPHYGPDAKDLTIIARDICGSFKDAAVDIDVTQKVITEYCNLERKEPGSYIWVSPSGKYPWSNDYIIRTWIGNPETDNDAVEINFSEYETLYEIGGILFRYDRVKTVDDTSEGQLLTDIENDIYAKIVYYDSSDETTKISELLKAAFETAEASGGLALTDGVDFDVEDTPSDKLNRMSFRSNEGDGDLVAFISELYSNPDIGLSPSYWIRDFNGDGAIVAKLVTQDNTRMKDIGAHIFSADFPTPLSSLYSRAVLVNNSATRRDICRESDLTDEFVNPVPGVGNTTEVGNIEYLRDGTAKRSWGYFSLQKFPFTKLLPRDRVLFQHDFGQEEEISGIFFNCHWTFTGHEGEDAFLHDAVTGFNAVNGLYMIYKPQRVTVEWSNNGTDWFIICPALYYREVDILTAEGSWAKEDNLKVRARYIRVVVNNPMYGKVGESNWANEAYRIMLWHMNEFVVLGSGRILDSVGGKPEVKFTDNASDPDRYLYDLSDTLIDMYRPKLLAKLEAIRLKYKTLFVEDEGVWDFETMQDVDPDNVSLGYKLLVTRLDAASRENEWTVQIMPRPDIRMGNTIYSSVYDVTKGFLVHGSLMAMNSGKLAHFLTVSDHESTEGG